MPCDRAFQNYEILFKFCVNGFRRVRARGRAYRGMAHKNNDVWRPDLPNFGLIGLLSWWTDFFSIKYFPHNTAAQTKSPEKYGPNENRIKALRNILRL